MVNQFIELILRFKIIPVVQIGVLCKDADKLEKTHIYTTVKNSLEHYGLCKCVFSTLLKTWISS